eukprot:4529884-Pleurochrysis_carterae.AAC.1
MQQRMRRSGKPKRSSREARPQWQRTCRTCSARVDVGKRNRGEGYAHLHHRSRRYCPSIWRTDPIERGRLQCRRTF